MIESLWFGDDKSLSLGDRKRAGGKFVEEYLREGEIELAVEIKYTDLRRQREDCSRLFDMGYDFCESVSILGVVTSIPTESQRGEIFGQERTYFTRKTMQLSC